MGRARKSDQLSDAEKKKVLDAYDVLPLGPKGTRLQGSVQELCQFWMISRGWLAALLSKRKHGLKL